MRVVVLRHGVFWHLLASVQDYRQSTAHQVSCVGQLTPNEQVCLRYSETMKQAKSARRRASQTKRRLDLSSELIIYTAMSRLRTWRTT